MKSLKVYLDTSVIGGCLDEEFSDDSNRLIQAVKDRKLMLVLSEVVFDEIREAPVEVQAILASILTGSRHITR